jgi:hypothetical protein
MNVAGCEVIGEQAPKTGENALYWRDRYLRHKVLGQTPVVLHKMEESLTAACHCFKRL